MALTLAFYVMYLAAALACLWRWHGPHPAERVDVFSGGFFALSSLWIVESLLVFPRVADDREARDEAFGETFDPAMSRWIPILALCELAVFLDYGHWRLVPALVHPIPQSIGLLLWAVVPFWLIWADRHLQRHFSSPGWPERIITGGPYAHVRHPRYLGLLASRLAFALLLGSAVAWVLGLGWALVVARRIHLEERHLHSRHGDRYGEYAARTARLVPGIY